MIVTRVKSLACLYCSALIVMITVRFQLAAAASNDNLTASADLGPRLRTTLCRDQCMHDDCRTFYTPLQTCYNGKQIFPKDPSWSAFDILDLAAAVNDGSSSSCGGTTTFERFIFESTDATCRGTIQDFFVLPINECVGPFGEPRPWGNFTIVVTAQSTE